MLFLDGVYWIDGERPVFRRLPAPSPQALERLVQAISQRVGAWLEREGFLVRDIENSYLQLETPDDSAMHDLLSHSITYRIAVGPPRPAVRRSRYKRCPHGRNNTITPSWPRPPASPRMPASQHKPINGVSWNGCAAMSPARLWP